MSQNEPDERKIVTPTSIDEESIEDRANKSPAEVVKSALGEDLYRDFVAAGDDHPLVREAGTKAALMSQTPAEVLKLLSDDLYQDPEVFWREWLQNHESACIREAKRVVKATEGIEELYHFIPHEHEALDEPRTLKLPKSSEEILAAAREYGYDPVVEFRVNHDERMIVTQDNGIAMTTGEVINVWKEPARSASGGDQSSAGNKGIGALTCFSMCGEQGAVMVKTRTRREHTIHTDEPVPGYDREGYHFYSFLGGVIPVPGEVEDGFYGTRFEIPVQEGVNLSNVKDDLKSYAEVSPVKILWTEIRNGGEATDEIEATTFFGQYSEEPAIQVDRPGEFALAIDRPGVVKKSIGDTDTWLLDMPIDRNTSVSLDTLWNDHVQIRNEQGLIIAGPNRGLRAAQVDALHDDDVVMPQPTADRDRLERGDDTDAFWRYLSEVAQQKETEEYAEFFNEYIQRDLTDALGYVVEHISDYQLLVKMLKSHGGHGLHESPAKLYNYFDAHDAFEFDASVTPRKAITKTANNGDRQPPRRARASHPKYEHLKLLVRLQEEIEFFTTHNSGDPNKSRNRGEAPIYEVLARDHVNHENIFVGRSLNQDRTRVAIANRDCPLVVKASSYGEWLGAPFHAEKLVDVPFKQGDHEWSVPDNIHENHTATTPDTETVGSHALKLRTEYGTQSIDYRSSVEAFEEKMSDVPFGNEIYGLVMDSTNEHRWVVLFPTTHERNVTDHTDWQRYAAIALATATEAERLLEIPQVFLPEEFEAFLAAAPVETYDPYTGAFETVRVDDLPAMDAGSVFVNPSETNLVNLLMGTRCETLPSDDDVYETLREHVFSGFFDDYGYNNPLTPNYVCDGCEEPYANAQGLSLHQNHCEDSDGENLADPDDPKLRVCWIPDNIDRHRVARYLDMVDHQVASMKGKRAHAGIRIDHDSPVTHRAVSDYTSLLERAEHLWSWDVGSAAWSRVKSTGYRMPRIDEVERGIYKALREHGIDPRTHSEEQIRLALLHLLDPEVNC